jgi:lysyl-tRNA synthetase, class II
METLQDLIKARLDKLAALKDEGVDIYPFSYDRTHTVAELLENFDKFLEEGKEIKIAGRLVAKRVMGKAAFAHIHDNTARVQFYVKRDDINNEERPNAYTHFKTKTDLGDWIGLRGVPFVTKTGEQTLEIREWTMLTKCVRPLPVVKEDAETGKRFHEYNDPNERYRNRALDLTVNPDEREVFRARAILISTMRRYLDCDGFLEVETPVLQPLYGGGTARPFMTHHNQLKKDLYLRIADELYLKRLIVGGMDRVYEISKDFRNEGVDRNHNPEFTMMECYAAFEDYTFMMDLVETVCAEISMKLNGKHEVPFGDMTINFEKGWARVKFFEALEEATGTDLLGSTLEDVKALADAKGISYPPKANWGKVVDEIFGELVEPNFTRPTFVIDYPLELSPLAKTHRSDDRLVERFEAFAGGMEIANAFSELNDPAEQRRRLEGQQEHRASGDEEAMPLDEEFIEVLELGMPPTAGLGLGIDRLTMMMTNRTSIRDVILFPLLRDQASSTDSEDSEE